MQWFTVPGQCPVDYKIRMFTVKHISTLTKCPVAKAGMWEDLICLFAQSFNAMLSFFGGASPLLLFVEDKCDIPTPNTES